VPIPPPPAGYSGSSSAPPPPPSGYSGGGGSDIPPPPAGYAQASGGGGATPNNLMPLVLKYAQANGVDPALVRAVMGREDASADPNATSSTGAHGLMQIEPATFHSLMGPNADITSPEANIAAGTKYLAQLSKQFKGDNRLVLAAYNAGPGAVQQYGGVPPYEETQKYVGNVLGDYSRLKSQGEKPVEAGTIPAPPPGFTKVATKVADQYAKGRTPGQIAASTLPAGHPLARAEAKAVNALNFIRTHPFEALGTAERGTAGFIDAMQRNKSFGDAVAEVKKYAWNPSAAAQKELDANLEQDAHMPSHEQVNMFIEHYAPKPIQKHLKALIGGGEDFTVESSTDPLNFLPVGKLGEGIGVGLRAMHGAAKAAGIGQAFAHLPAMSKELTDIKDGMQWLFKTRPDLDPYLDKENKMRRFAIENSEAGKAARWSHEDREIVKDTQKSVDRYTNHYAPMIGRPRAVNIPAMSPEQRATFFGDLRKKITEKAIADRSKQTLHFKPGVQASWDKVPHQPEAAVQMDPRLNKVLGITRYLGKQAVQLIPYPHALWNVGMLTYLNGGPLAFMRGLAHTVHGLDPALVKRMNDIGAAASYTHDVTGPASALNRHAQHVEQSWRAGLLETLDKRLGPSKSAADELLKGHLVNDAAGDYRNHNAFVQTFMALGGPFVSFGLGIIPKAGAKALTQHPGRLETVYRVQEDIQRNRTDKNANKLDIGGPAGDLASMAKNPLKYAISPSRAGIFGSIAQMAYSMDHPGLSEMLDGFTQAIYPPYGIAREFGDIALGRGMETSNAKGQKAYEKSSLSDKLAEAMMKFFTTARYNRPESKSQTKEDENAAFRRP